MPPPPYKKMMDSAMQESHRSVPTPFLTKTHQIVENPAVDDVISWNEDGSTFVVWRPVEFARDLLPKYFKHNNFSSFVRQLNTYVSWIVYVYRTKRKFYFFGFFFAGFSEDCAGSMGICQRLL